ncbi:MAG: NUDIX hydrolase [Chloroflexota bacterium]|nr:MAG: NUDIX hydrolase [Chloroflexota bacterium]
MNREYPAYPIPGVGVLAFDGAKFLLIRRGKPPRAGEWSIPGGAIELGETARAAAVREFTEECGGVIELREVVDVVDIFWRDEQARLQYHYVVVDFWAEWRGGELRAQSDAMAARWVAVDELPQYNLPAQTQSMIEKAIARRAQK